MKWYEMFIGVFMFLIVLVITIWLGIVISVRQVDDLLLVCYEKGFPTRLEMHNDYDGFIDCKEFYEETYLGKWNKRCSNFFFSEKMSCHDLCNIDCEYRNKFNNGEMCVC